MFSFKFQNRTLSPFFFCPLGKDRNKLSSCDPAVNMKQFYMCPLIFLLSFFHALYFSVHGKGRNLSSTGVAAELNLNV